MEHIVVDNLLFLADTYANMVSGCTKVSVGSAIVKDGRIVSLGANRCIPNLCKVRGCLRVEKYGNNDKEHRNPGDCRAIHSEIDAICRAQCNIMGSEIYITRYPCESCARAIVAAGIKTVWYGRGQKISEETARIFESGDVNVYWVKDWDAPDATN